MEINKNNKTKQQIETLFKNIFLHIQRLPAPQIQEAVILVSFTNQTSFAFKKIVDYQQELSGPTSHNFNNQFTLIYPTDSFLKPEFKDSFISMHYLLKTVKRAKFLFVFGHVDASNETKIKNVKQAFGRLFALLNKSEEGSKAFETASKLSSCCGIVINQSQKDPMKYLQMLKKLGQETSYLSDPSTRKFAQCLTLDERKPFPIGKKNLTKEELDNFSKFVESIRYFELEGFEQSRLGQLQYEFSEYAGNNLSQKWENILLFIIQKIDLLMVESLEIGKEDDLRPTQAEIKDKFQQFFISKLDQQGQQREDVPQKASLRLIEFIRSYIVFIQDRVKKINGDGNIDEKKVLLLSFIDMLYKCGFITISLVKFFFQSYFDIYRFLYTKDDASSKIFQGINWKYIFASNKNLFNEKIRVAITTLFKALTNQLEQADQKYDFDKINSELNLLTQSLDGLSHSEQYNFLTVRTFKKIKKFRAQFAFKKASLLSRQVQRQYETIEAWLQFLESSQESTLIKPKQIVEGLNFIANYLTQKQQYKLALRMYRCMPEHKSYRKIRNIYERGMKFYPQILKYTLMDNWYNQEKNFVQYCNFLLRMGKNQDVRELCLEGIGATQALDNSDATEEFGRLLVHARSENSRELHNNILDNEVMEQLVIKLEEELIKEVREKVKQIRDEAKQLQ